MSDNTELLNVKKRMPDILECIANLSSDEVFTPPSIANKLLDLVPKNIWSNPDTKILDPCCKTGIFLREAAKRLMTGLAEVIPDEKTRREHIFSKMLYGYGITELTSLISRRTLYYSKKANGKESIVKFDDTDGNIKYQNLTHTFKNGKCIYCGAAEKEYRRDKELEQHAYNFIHPNNLLENMTFDLIIGNPPYQLGDGGHGASAKPLYHKFVEQAKKLEPKYISMIIPARWYAGGKGLDEFRAEMLADKRLRYLVDYPDAAECFPGVEIKGGVCYFLWDEGHKATCEVKNIVGGKETDFVERDLSQYEVFIRFNEAVGILKKVQAKGKSTLDSKVSSRKPFGFATNFDNYKNQEFEDSVKIYVRGEVGWIDKDLITVNQQWVSEHKVLLARASEGSGSFPNGVTGKPIVADNNSCCTETYLVIDTYDTQEEAQNMADYIKTRFFRFLVSLKKNTQDTNKDRFSFVPDLDMSQAWSDEVLYKRYGINEKEQKFIESMVKEMK